MEEVQLIPVPHVQTFGVVNVMALFILVAVFVFVAFAVVVHCLLFISIMIIIFNLLLISSDPHTALASS